MKVGFLSSYPPRRCGIAEFNQDLLNALSPIPNFSFCGIAINQNDAPEKFETKYKIIAQIRKNIKTDYFEVAKQINQSDIDLLCIQLEYALYGGFDGAYLKLLINSLQKKTIIIVHGSPINQYSRRPIIRKGFFKAIKNQVFQFITINPLQKKRFHEWGIKQVTNILHGAPDEIKHFSYSVSRQKLGLTKDELMIFNFGLLHKKKGLPYLLTAFLDFLGQNSKAKLFLSGHPVDPETKNYLAKFIKHLHKLNLQNSLVMEPYFQHRRDLFFRIAASDIVVTPYIKKDHVSSGPLSFAAFAQKFIITTPFPYALQLLNKHQAYFVPYKDSRAIYEAFVFYVQNQDKVKHYQSQLRELSGKIAWSKTAKKYYQLFQQSQ